MDKHHNVHCYQHTVDIGSRGGELIGNGAAKKGGRGVNWLSDKRDFVDRYAFKKGKLLSLPLCWER